MQAAHDVAEGADSPGLAVQGQRVLPASTAPRTRAEAEELIPLLSNDIGLILAQLAEDEAAWCRRTGRSPLEYAGWRRRALFAKVHKERQLRECKRTRNRLAGAFADVQASGPSPDALLDACRGVIEAWDAAVADRHRPLDRALLHLAYVLDRWAPAHDPATGLFEATAGAD